MEDIFYRFNSIDKNLKFTLETSINYDIDNHENRKIIIFPYIQNFQEQLCTIFKTYNIQIIFTIENTFQKKMFPTLKDKTLTKFKYNIIYEINCIQCNKKYIGQTCRFLHNRLLEHTRSIKKIENKENKTALAEHAITNKHSFDFKNTKILDFKNNFKKRLILDF